MTVIISAKSAKRSIFHKSETANPWSQFPQKLPSEGFPVVGDPDTPCSRLLGLLSIQGVDTV